ncbi:MAG TPA: histidine kinase [Acidimicrobiales bacterium]
MESGGRWRPDWRDVALALVTAAFLVATAVGGDRGSELDALGWGLVLTPALVLAARRRAPTAVLVVVMGCLLAYQLRDYPEMPAVPVLVAVFTAARAGRRVVTIAVASVVLVAGVLAVRPDPGEAWHEASERRVLIIGWVVSAGVTAEVIRQREAAVRAAEERAAEAERTREETARRRAGEERLRIARELHDSLTHSISVIKVQAGVAIHLARKRGEEVPEALLAIQEASRDATRELRATLEVLRSPDAGAEANSLGGDAAGSGLDRLGELVERAGAAGVPATVAVTGDRRRLPAEVDRAAYRIVQEALTNVGRHAGRPARATVRLDYRPDSLAVQVEDDGRARPDAPPVPGTGLIGMRERVTALGGTLHAAPRAEGGFAVRAVLPTNGRPVAGAEAPGAGEHTGPVATDAAPT